MKIKPLSFVQVFENPLREQSLIPDHVIVTIFSNVRQIININQELYEYLTTLGKKSEAVFFSL